MKGKSQWKYQRKGGRLDRSGNDGRTKQRQEDRAVRSLCMKEIEAQERKGKRMWVTKKYGTKTKTRVRNVEKEVQVEFGAHSSAKVESTYLMPVRLIPLKKGGESSE